ncbi:hypothetical protein NBO_66g0021 [Nosema bombycis CQ1]|uniref:Uncharacterized protein n=1 Tax=Nosema bombycis (strain CQ1 / CVCC 102059) TaxID=578461 RepID=R0KTK5_NOSB1|nr:hypothetical protein NBO_66g0021 [Nosema bombycis CQ1]|eukprot:EOB13562.1 hypothetical protein NBO_66g0021 [Nosema bombycis CQ1]
MNFKIIMFICTSALTSPFPNVKKIASMYNKLAEKSLKVSPRSAPRTYSKKYRSFLQTTEANLLPVNQEEGRFDFDSLNEKCKTDSTSQKAGDTESSSLSEQEHSDSPLKLYQEGIKSCTNETLSIKKLSNPTESNLSDDSQSSDEVKGTESSDTDENTLPSDSSFISKYFLELNGSSLSNDNPHALTTEEKAFTEVLSAKKDNFAEKLRNIDSLN